jgi:hypothetical protein
VIGNERTRALTALKMVLAIAGAMTVTAGSPQPTAGSPLAMMLTSSSILHRSSANEARDVPTNGQDFPCRFPKGRRLTYETTH